MLTHLHPYRTWLTCGHRSTLRRGLSRPCVRTAPGPAKHPEPLCLVEALARPAECPAPRQQTLPCLHRSYGLMRQSKSLPPPRASPRMAGLCRLSSVPAGRWTFPTFTLRTLPDVPGPIPRWPLRCTYSFLPSGQRPSPTLQRVGAPQNPGQPLQSRGSFRGCSHSLTFRPAGLLATPVAPTAAPRRGHWAAVASTPGHPTVRYLPVVQVC
jgi:hypothetical protein